LKTAALADIKAAWGSWGHNGSSLKITEVYPVNQAVADWKTVK
jgi:hypothetical protein